MKIGELHGFEFRVPTSGGKAGKGFNKTSSLQVLRGNLMVRQFRFVVGDAASRKAAIEKARQFVSEQAGAGS